MTYLLHDFWLHFFSSLCYFVEIFQNEIISLPQEIRKTLGWSLSSLNMLWYLSRGKEVQIYFFSCEKCYWVLLKLTELLNTSSGIQWWYVGSYKRDDTLQILFVFQASLMQAQWCNILVISFLPHNRLLKIVKLLRLKL